MYDNARHKHAITNRTKFYVIFGDSTDNTAVYYHVIYHTEHIPK